MMVGAFIPLTPTLSRRERGVFGGFWGETAGEQGGTGNDWHAATDFNLTRRVQHV